MGTADDLLAHRGFTHSLLFAVLIVPIMAMAARKTVATVHEQVALGELDPETVVTPGIFVQAVVKIDRVATQAGGIKA